MSIRVEREREERGREIGEVRTWGERCRSESMGRERGSEREKEWGESKEIEEEKKGE